MAHSSHKIPAFAVAPPRELEREPLVQNQRSFGWISDKIAGIAEGRTPTWWWIAMAISVTGMLTMFGMIAYLISTGVGVWGLHQPTAWAWDITNFVFWIGIGHAGTLISAILFLLRQRWRTSDQPRRRGHDHLRRHVRGPLPGYPRRPALARLLAFPDPQPDGHVAAVPLAAALGRVRGLDLRHRLAAVLVHRA